MALLALSCAGQWSVFNHQLTFAPLHAQSVSVTGSVQSDMMVANKDSETGFLKGQADGFDTYFMNNTYADVALQSKYVDAGMRFEYLDYPMPGFNDNANPFAGRGFSNIYVKGKLKNVELTGGSFYEQFGSGFILRSYEERSLGIDNSLLGGRVVYTPYKGITLKALSGVQRTYWELKKNTVSGADVELNIEEWAPKMQKAGTRLSLGGSWVNKYERSEFVMADAFHRYNFPKFVNAFDVRANLRTHGFGLLAEYAFKTQDPTLINGYDYSNGQVGMLSASYSKKGMSFLAQARRSELMDFRSERNINRLSRAAYINHLPAFTMDHTYALAALYPYATQPDGEWAVQGSAAYTFKRKTKLGGKYGMTVKVNLSHVRNDGQTYYQDINVQLERKFTKQFKLNLMYMNQKYNQTVMEGHGGMVNANIAVAEGRYQFNRKYTLRMELQYLHTPDDDKDWLYGMAELSIVPHWMISLSDMYNVGRTNTHYYQGSVTYNLKAHRIQLGYVRNRAGFNCSGGVCRRVPASRGVTLSYNYNF